VTSDGATLVTGANGFIGRVLCDALAASGRGVRRAVRAAGADDRNEIAVGDIGPATDWRAALEGVSHVAHLAARTHVLRETAGDPLAEYRTINVSGTERLARSAVACGVRRLVFLSSVKVNGEHTGERPYTEKDAPAPEDPYGVSKWEAEQALARIAAETGLEVVMLRSPLVYGPGVKGNFLRLMDLVARGVPLPLGAVANRRSLVYSGNLAAAIVTALDSPQAAGKTYLVSDGEDVSTPDLIHALAQSLGAKPRFVALPLAVLGVVATLAGKRSEFVRLTGSLQVDSSRIRRELGWRPPFTLAQGLDVTAKWYLDRARRG
jgi:nucleoside-diphosphate-sugar epimerase